MIRSPHGSFELQSFYKSPILFRPVGFYPPGIILSSLGLPILLLVSQRKKYRHRTNCIFTTSYAYRGICSVLLVKGAVSAHLQIGRSAVQYLSAER